MDKQEPTMSKPDLDNVEFRPRSYRGPSRSPVAAQDDGLWLKLIATALIVIVVIMGLIEWNARRQVAALERAMTPTPEEIAKLKAETRAMEQERRFQDAQDAHELARMQQEIWGEAQRAMTPRPLSQGERCMGGKRLVRIEGGWRDLPHDPC